MSNLVNYSQVLLTTDVKRSFEENYLKMLFEKHKDLPKSDIIEFIHKAQQTGANPSLNQIFLIERNTKVGFEWKKVGTVVFSYNFIQAVANQTGEYEGYVLTTGLHEKFDIHNFDAKKMLASHCVVKRKGHEFPYTAYFDEYVQCKDGKATGTWASKPYMMIEKCALSGALRRAFPEALSGMYCEEEMQAIEEQLDRKAQNDVIETTATVQAEKTEQIVEKAKAENYEDKAVKMDAIKVLLGEMTVGKTTTEKAKALKEFCSVSKFDDLKDKTPEELTLILEKITAVKTETKNRELKKAKQTAPTFNLGE